MLHVAIPSGFTHFRQLGGVPLAAALVFAALPLCIFAMVSLLWALISIHCVALLWFFTAYQTKKDPAWFPLWVLHLQLKGYYAAS